MAEALKDIKINELKNCFQKGISVSISELYQIQNTWKVTEA